MSSFCVTYVASFCYSNVTSPDQFHHVSCEVLTAAKIQKAQVFWDVTSRRYAQSHWHFGGPQRFHLQGQSPRSHSP